jgi:hypothetical protein
MLGRGVRRKKKIHGKRDCGGRRRVFIYYMRWGVLLTHADARFSLILLLADVCHKFGEKNADTRTELVTNNVYWMG